jgi:hypothetical protein
MPLPFGATVPYAILLIQSFSVNTGLWVQSTSTRPLHFNKVTDTIIAKKQEDLYMKQTDLSYEPHPLVQLYFLRDASECPGALDDLKKVFGIKKAQQLHVPPANHTTMETQIFVLAKPEDKEKKRAKEMSLHKLSIIFAADSNSSFESGVKNFEDGLQGTKLDSWFQQNLEHEGRCQQDHLLGQSHQGCLQQCHQRGNRYLLSTRRIRPSPMLA